MGSYASADIYVRPGITPVVCKIYQILIHVILPHGPRFISWKLEWDRWSLNVDDFIRIENSIHRIFIVHPSYIHRTSIAHPSYIHRPNEKHGAQRSISKQAIDVIFLFRWQDHRTTKCFAQTVYRIFLHRPVSFFIHSWQAYFYHLCRMSLMFATRRGQMSCNVSEGAISWNIIVHLL